MKLVIQNILNDKARARLGFQIDLADVLADYTNGQQDQTADCPNRADHAGPSKNGSADRPSNDKVDQHENAHGKYCKAKRSNKADWLGRQRRNALHRKGKHFLERILALACKALTSFVSNYVGLVADHRYNTAQEKVDFLKLCQALQRPLGHQAVIGMVEHGIGTQKAHHTIETFCGKALEERIFLARGTDTVDNIATFVVLVHHRVNRIASPAEWGPYIVSHTQDQLAAYNPKDVEFAMFFPEAHLIGAVSARKADSALKNGPQSVLGQDTAVGGNFGAFTSNRTGNAMKAIGCDAVLIGHCEERRDKLSIIAEGKGTDAAAVNRILNKEIKAAIAAGLDVLYCIGENADEQPRWQEVLKEQLTVGLEGVDKSKVTIAYEPVWAIGPGKIPPDADYIRKIASYVKEVTDGMDVVYGGGLKTDNAKMLASVKEIDGGLIALTRFSGEIGFYPDEYLEIIKTYLGY